MTSLLWQKVGVFNQLFASGCESVLEVEKLRKDVLRVADRCE